MVLAILATYRRATPEQHAAGAAWYADARRIATAIADVTGVERRRVTTVIAALSPRNPWRWNVADAYAFCAARVEGRTMPTATTFGRNQRAAWAALDPTVEDPWRTSALKVRAFVAAIEGDPDAVVVDTWAVRVATSGAVDRVERDRDYVTVADAYRVAAGVAGIEPASIQAITWLVAQTEGLASRRRGRTDMTFKAGTPTWLKEVVA